MSDNQQVSRDEMRQMLKLLVNQKAELERKNERYREALEEIWALAQHVNALEISAGTAWYKALGIAHDALEESSDA